MKPNIYVGTWNLVGYFSETGEFELLADIEEYRRVYKQWLCDAAPLDSVSFAEMSGLTLVINSDGTFTESKTSSVQFEWFDEEGVLDNSVTPFSGVYKTINKRAFLTLRNSSASERIRYDDGDTKICDSLRLVDEHLIRTVSVITDEMYTNRIFLRYRKS